MALLEVTEEEAMEIWLGVSPGWKGVEQKPVVQGFAAKYLIKIIKRLSDGKCFEVYLVLYEGCKPEILTTTLDEVELREVTVVTKQWVAVGGE